MLLHAQKDTVMVGLLIVSHSSQIAAGVKELAEQMTGGTVRISAVGGTRDGRLGTNPDGIRASFEAMAGPDGVLVLMDLGSAVMSATYALEGAEYPVLLSDAPLVEGTLLAAVEASIGGDLRRTAAAAESARELHKTAA
jgi:dihydroxyacetone kinase phosphotransfer subunit